MVKRGEKLAGESETSDTVTEESAEEAAGTENMEAIAEGTILPEETVTAEALSESETGEEEAATEPEKDGEEVIRQALKEMLQEMTLEEKVGQMFFIHADGGVPQEAFDNYHIGGVLLFGEDFQGKTPETLIQYIQGFQENSKYPLLIGTDEEGGTVSRLSGNSALVEEAFQSPQNLYEKDGYDAIEADTHYKAQLLLSYGINVNFAPVCDLAFGPEDFMHKRAFGTNVEETCQYVSLVVQVMEEERIGSVLKHFPGYGSNGDTHKSIITDAREFSEFEAMDFLPFSAGITSGADCVMVSHNIVTVMDETHPASLSPAVHRILREELGFDGVIITDDLGMSGVTQYTDTGEAAVLAVQAGNDMLLSEQYPEQYQAVLDAVNEGVIPEEQIDGAVLRILRWKYDLGLLENISDDGR